LSMSGSAENEADDDRVLPPSSWHSSSYQSSKRERNETVPVTPFKIKRHKIHEIDPTIYNSYSALLQVFCVKCMDTTPKYVTKGPDANANFVTEVFISNILMGTGCAPNKKKSQHEAASFAIKQLAPELLPDTTMEIQSSVGKMTLEEYKKIPMMDDSGILMSSPDFVEGVTHLSPLDALRMLSNRDYATTPLEISLKHKDLPDGKQEHIVTVVVGSESIEVHSTHPTYYKEWAAQNMLARLLKDSKPPCKMWFDVVKRVSMTSGERQIPNLEADVCVFARSFTPVSWKS